MVIKRKRTRDERERKDFVANSPNGGRTYKPYLIELPSSDSTELPTKPPAEDRPEDRNNVPDENPKSPQPTKDEKPSLESNEETVARMSKEVASWFVRSGSQYLLVEKLNSPLTQAGVRQIAFRRMRERFPGVELSNEVVKQVFQRVISETHDDFDQTIPIWDSTLRCCPGNPARTVRDGEMVSINSWHPPAYRDLRVTEADVSRLEEFLSITVPHEQDRGMVLNWLTWCLQNEASKPGWSLFFYSGKKGTGKSTLCGVIAKLFGEKNTITLNSVDKLASRFNKPVLDSKLVIGEELKLPSGSSKSNSLKTFITEEVTSSEQKGHEIEKVRQFCCFLFTSNHRPDWIEADERRYLVVEVKHDGHASGPKADEFGTYVAELNAWMEDPANIARLYNGLIARRVSADFNPKALNLSKLTSPIMKQLNSSSQEVVLQQLEQKLAELGKFAVPQEDLIKLCVEELKIKQNRLGHLMLDLDWRSEKLKWGGVDYARAIWVHSDYQVVRGRVLGPDGYEQPVDPDAEDVEIIGDVPPDAPDDKRTPDEGRKGKPGENGDVDDSGKGSDDEGDEY